MNQKISLTKNFGRVLLLTLILCLFANACTGRNKEVADSSLHVAVTDLHYNYSWDIHKIRGLYTHLISYLIAEPPIRVKADGSYYPSIFKNWAFSKDKLVLTVEISDSFTFHDGTPIKTGDVVFSLLRALNSKAKQGGHNDLINSLCGGKECDIKPVGKNKLQFRFKTYANAIIPSFTLPELSIFPESYYAREDKKEILGNLSGPYRVVSFEPGLMVLEAHESHSLIKNNSPKKIFLHEIKSDEDLNQFFQKYENAVVYSEFSNRAASLNLLDAKVKVLPPMVAEVVQLNRFSPRFRNEQERRRVASKLYKTFRDVKGVKKFTKNSDQYFPKYSIAYLDSVESFYEKNFGSTSDDLTIVTYEELGFDDVFKKYVNLAPSNFLNLKTKVLEKDKFFAMKNETGNDREQVDAFYYFSGVGASDPIFELTYMVERTNAGRYATPKILDLLNKARFERDRSKYVEYIKAVHATILNQYLMVPVRHSSPVFHYKGIYKPSEDYYSGDLDFWDWIREN